MGGPSFIFRDIEVTPREPQRDVLLESDEGHRGLLGLVGDEGAARRGPQGAGAVRARPGLGRGGAGAAAPSAAPCAPFSAAFAAAAALEQEDIAAVGALFVSA